MAALRAAHPQLVVVSVTPFGLTGPYAGWAGEEIVAYAMGGPMHATGVADREPSKFAGAIVQVQTGNSAAVAALGRAAAGGADRARAPTWTCPPSRPRPLR